MFCNWFEVPVVVQQLAMMFECRGGNDGVVGLADGNALLSQLAIYVGCPHEYTLKHWQHYQGVEIVPDAPLRGVIGNALEDLCQNDAAQGKVFIIEDELLQRGHMGRITTCKEVDSDAGVNENH